MANDKKLTKEEVYELIKKYRENNDIEAYNKLVTSNLRLVYSVAVKICNNPQVLDDIVQEGTIGLITAINKFDLSYGVEFSTYAVYRIRQSILFYLSKNDYALHYSYQDVTDMKKINAINLKYQMLYGRNATVEELEEITKMPKDKIETILNKTYKMVSLDNKFTNQEGDTGIDLYDTVSLLGDEVEEKAFIHFRSEEVEELLNTLTSRERDIICMRMGFKDYTYSLEEIGKIYNITRERVRQIEKRAYEKLTKAAEEKNLKLYLER